MLKASDLPNQKISDSAESDSYFQIRNRPNPNLVFKFRFCRIRYFNNWNSIAACNVNTLQVYK